MKYIKVFAEDFPHALQDSLDKYCSEHKHNIIQQCSNVSYYYDVAYGHPRTKYLLTVTFDDGDVK